ncbi:DUF3489 domain-containing protein [Brucella tritici]|nr:DUF3489 domain-containing protein [Brucella tritici]
MKSYNVKSNAKRFARGIASKYPAMYVAAEPVPVSEGAREWYPALTIVGEEYRAVMAEVRATCVMTNDDDENDIEKAEPVIAAADVQADTVVVTPQILGRAIRANEETKPSPVIVDYAAALSSLPPRKASSAEEIEARRAERRERIEAEKANPTPKLEKINKKKILLDLLRRENGATQAELEAATGWQRHTIRGYIAGTLRKQMAPLGREIACIRAKGAPTLYVIKMKGAEA